MQRELTFDHSGPLRQPGQLPLRTNDRFRPRDSSLFLLKLAANEGKRHGASQPVAIGPSLNCLVHSEQQRLGKGNAERSRRLVIDDEFELRWLLHGQVSWSCTP